jgi:glyoxylase-like metal-dependent hydrolase (beta-lactamase superfamily II)
MIHASRRFVATLVTLAAAGAMLASRQPPPAYEVYAIRYATIPGFRVSGLIAGADTSRRLDIAMMVWLARGGGRVVVMDAGFKRADLIQRWKPVDYVTPAAAVERFGVRADDVTDVIISHVHWDHLDGVDLFPKATIWIQRDEYEHHVDSLGHRLANAIDTADASMLFRLRQAGRVRLVDGDAREIMPGITVYIGGKHTFQSQYATVHIATGTVVLASDNMYLYENLDLHLPIAQTLDAASNLAAQERMTHLASEARLIVPGHDPAVFERFPRPGNGVARIQ